MDTKKPNHTQTEDDLNWERRLEQLRQTRKINTPYTHAPLVRESKDVQTADAPAKPANPPRYKLDDESRDKVLREYMRKWQDEHNAEAAQGEEVETDAMVLLQENWLNAQSSLQMHASEKHIESMLSLIHI